MLEAILRFYKQRLFQLIGVFMEETISKSEQNDLTSLPISTLMWRYCLPTTVSMLIIGVYFVVDGIFVGHYVGEMGLEDVVLSLPMLGFLFATGILVGMGASSLVSIKRGQGKHQAAKKIVQNAIILTAIFSVMYMMFGTFLSEQALMYIGASEDTIEMIHPYIYWYFALAFCPIASLTFTTLLRNDNKPGLVTVILISGGLLNIALDWLFLAVFEMGLKGAAIASMISQGVTALWAIYHLVTTQSSLRICFDNFKFDKYVSTQILKVGFPSFLMELYLSAIIAVHNGALLWVGGAVHLAAYGIIVYIEDFYYLLFTGIALGLQPILSFNMGAKLYHRVRQAYFTALKVALIIAGVGLVLIYGFPELIVSAFHGDSQELYEIGTQSMTFYFWALPFEAILLISTAFFQAIGLPKQSTLITVYKLLALCLFMLMFAWIFGVNGIWFVIGASSLVVLMWVFWQLLMFYANTRSQCFEMQHIAELEHEEIN